MNKLVKIQIRITIILVLLFIVLLLGILTDIKYIIEASPNTSNMVIETVYADIKKLSIMFLILSAFIITNSVLLFRKIKKETINI